MVLIVEDKGTSKSIIKPGLKLEGNEIKVCNNGAKALKIIKDLGARIVVVDRDLPEMDGIALCSQIRQLNLKKYVYIIIANDNGKDVLEAFDAGADDYIPRPYKKEELTIRVKVGMRMLELEDKLNKTRRELIKLAKEDPVTGLLNRRSFLDEAINELDRASREHKIVSTIMIDIDDFRELNDAFGLEAGDNVLVEIAGRLQASCRPYDKVARYGSGSFLILLPNTRTKTAVRIAKRMQKEVADRTFFLNKEDVKITACFGISLLAPDVGLKDSQIDDLLKRTELALNKAKKEGRNKMVVNVES